MTRGGIQSTNPGATRMLRAPLAAFEGQPLAEVPGLGEFAQNVQQQFEDFEVERMQHGLDHWQQPFELHAGRRGMAQDAINIVARGAEMPGAARGCWCSTTSRRSFPPSARRPGAKWRGALRTRSRIRSRPSSCRPSASR